MKRAFITGTSCGIGLEIAKALTTRGFEVWGTSRDLKRLPSLPNFHPLQMDLSNQNNTMQIFEQVLRDAQYFDILINNAGNGYYAPLEEMSPEVVREQFEILVFAPFELIRLVLPSMRKRGSGLIINITSLAARFPVPFMSAYNAAKAALSSMTECLRIELGNFNIQILDIQPGDISTHFNEAVRKSDISDQSDYHTSLMAAWNAYDQNMKKAPHPQRVAKRVIKLIQMRTVPPVVTIGSFFQAKIAPVAQRLIPHHLIEKIIRIYYGLR